MSANKAYVISNRDTEYVALVYAPTRNEARATRPDGFEDFEYIEIDAKRCKKADVWASEGRTIEYNSERLRSLGWYEMEGRYADCEFCGLYEWFNVEGSAVCEWCNRCGLCGHERNCLAALCETLLGEYDESVVSAHDPFSNFIGYDRVWPKYKPSPLKLWSLRYLGVCDE